MKRRTFLKRAGMVGVALGGVSARAYERTSRPPARLGAADARPNILIILVDQMRYPQWFPDQAKLDGLLPALARLRSGAVRFTQHYTAANACTPARACLLTGLYAHQTACLLTIANRRTPRLHPGFPTWGALLRGQGYQTYWYGKWHLSATCDLEPYGFSGGTCPSPNGAPGQGLAKDPQIANQFLSWLQKQTAAPWCTTVSLVNPHDIVWYYQFSNQVAGEDNPPSVFTALPPNFETPADLQAQHKPRLQQAQQQLAADSFGGLPFNGPGFEGLWLRLLDLYLQLQQYVDSQIGRILDALAASSSAANTIVLFTADHGEYGGSHGLRGKGGGIYDEAIRVPLYIKDPTGAFAGSPEMERTQLTSSVDIAPLLFTIATGGDEWRSDPQYAHLAGRLDLAAILRDPDAPGRPYILHTTDEDFIEEITDSPYTINTPSHVIGLRTATAKIGIYSFWQPGSIRIDQDGQETECYDYSTPQGPFELQNVTASNKTLYNQLYAILMLYAIPNELRRPLPANLLSTQETAMRAYLLTQLKHVFLPMVVERDAK